MFLGIILLSMQNYFQCSHSYFRFYSGILYEPTHDKTNNKTCATSEDSDQTAHPRSLIRVFADRMCLLQPQSYPKRNKQEPFPYWVAEEADFSLCWSNMSYCKFCRALAHYYTHREISEQRRYRSAGEAK